MNYKFYHGTSDLFLHSIKANGLGAINPSLEHGYLDTLKYLWNLAEKTLIDKIEYKYIRDTTTAMALQTQLKVFLNNQNQILNFRHDGIYISLSREKAVVHANINKYGSEIICTSIKLMEILEKYQIPYYNRALPIDQIISFRKMNPKSIIVKINKLDEFKIHKEDGKTAKEALDFLRIIENDLSNDQKQRFFMQCNFKLLERIPPVDLEFFELDCIGKYGDSDFEYTLTRLN